MKNIYSLLIAALCLNISIAQDTWSRVKVFGTDAELSQLGTLGLPIDHGEHKSNTHFMTDLSATDIAKLDAHGFNYEIVIADVQAYYQDQTRPSTFKGQDRASCPSVGSAYNPITPTNFNLGTMAGFYTYQEFIDELDDMKAQYPNLITAKAPIDTYTTVDGNPIYWLRISDNADTDEAEEEVLYTSLHHAREPASLSQTIYYMWYMLENYGTDPEVTFLVDNTEMYFVPMINPDGYRFNELNSPGGGGMHRKNRNTVSGGGGNSGVDLNRNYSYHWDESGTSNNPGNDTWPGVGEFSEVETNAIKWLCTNHNFKFAFNAHTHGNLLLYPIGWSSVEVAPHANYFEAYSSHMVEHNGYSNIKSSGLYPAAGDSDDWMYIDSLQIKDTIFAITPEVSSEGTGNDFWPPSSAIEEICRANVHMNMTLAHMPLVFGVTEDIELSKVNTTTGYFSYELERLGLMNGAITVSMTPVAGIQTMGTGNVHNLNLMEIVEDSISYTLDGAIAFGDDIIYILETDNGSWIRKDTIYKTYGVGSAVFTDDCTNLNNWSGDWSFTNEDFVSPNNCITDSPFTDYSHNSQTECQLNQAFNFGNATYAYINFWAKWEIENDWDYAQFMISTDNGTTWIPLCGKYTNQGGNNQDFDNPLYDNFQTDWVYEEIDLSGYIGNTSCLFKFQLIADGGVKEDGFYFDDFSIYTDASGNTEGIDELSTEGIQLYPNPSTDVLFIQIENPALVGQIEITNELGQCISTITSTQSKISLNTANLAEGIYFVSILGKNDERIVKRFTVIR